MKEWNKDKLKQDKIYIYLTDMHLYLILSIDIPALSRHIWSVPKAVLSLVFEYHQFALQQTSNFHLFRSWRVQSHFPLHSTVFLRQISICFTFALTGSGQSHPSSTRSEASGFHDNKWTCCHAEWGSECLGNSICNRFRYFPPKNIYLCKILNY